jgi:hypothetical protein
MPICHSSTGKLPFIEEATMGLMASDGLMENAGAFSTGT